MEPETVIPESNDDRIKQLEEALESAAKERQEILEAAEKEIDYHRSIAAELESSMINDFEWKLHEIESEYNRKLREAHPEIAQPSTSRRRSPIKAAAAAISSATYDHELFEQKLQLAKNEIVRQKDDELAKMHIQIRKEMDDKLRIERNSLKTALDTNHATEMQRAVENAKRDAKHEFKTTEKHLKDENDKLQLQIQTLNKDIEALRTQMNQAINDAIQEGDKKAFEERKRSAAHTEHHQEEMDKIKDDFNGQISRLRVEYDEKVEDLEKRLEVALGAKLEHMLALREEVEQEYADRMEELRNMYRTEMDSQTETYEREREKFKQLESSMSETLKVKRQEAEEFKSKCDDLSVKVEELTTRLENQTAEVLRLTMELEEYEYKDYGNGNTRSNSNTLQNDEGSSDYEYVDDEEEEGKDPWPYKADYMM